jgi:hypothetical protein
MKYMKEIKCKVEECVFREERKNRGTGYLYPGHTVLCDYKELLVDVIKVSALSSE